MNVIEVEKAHKAEPRGVVGHKLNIKAKTQIGRVAEGSSPKSSAANKEPLVYKGSFKSVFFGFLTTVAVSVIFFILVSLIVGELNDLSKNILLMLVGFSAAFSGGVVLYNINARNYVMNLCVLVSIFVFINLVFNLLPGFNIQRALFSFLLAAVVYPIPFFLGALFSKRYKVFS